jgi:uncharacterized protein with PIN domain
MVRHLGDSAILRNEADADVDREAVERAESLCIGAPTLLECEIVASMSATASPMQPPLPGTNRFFLRAMILQERTSAGR